MKIVVFIAPYKFKNLFTNDVNSYIPDFSKLDIKSRSMVYLGGNNNLVYIKPEGVTCSVYNEKLFNESPIILLDDSYELNHMVDSEFKLLYHGETETNFSNKVTAIKNNPKCIGFLKSKEEVEANGKFTPYYELVKLIENKITEESIKFIYDQIPIFNATLEAKLNLLHECLTPESASEVNKIPNYTLIKNLRIGEETVDSFIKKYFVSSKDNLAKDYIEKLTELRISLLGS